MSLCDLDICRSNIRTSIKAFKQVRSCVSVRQNKSLLWETICNFADLIHAQTDPLHTKWQENINKSQLTPFKLNE